MVGMLEKIFGGQRHMEQTPAVMRSQRVRERVDMNAPVLEADYVAFDTELTGLDLKRDSIISIGAIKMKGAGIYPMETFYSLVKPERPLKSEGVLVHEITKTDLEDACGLAGVLDEFLEFVGDAVLVGHFVSIDMNFVNNALKKLYGVKLQSPATDTHSIHDWLYENDADFARHYKGMTSRKDLFSMARRYGLGMEKAHNAFHDAYLTAQLFQRFLYFLPPCGVHSVGDLVSVGKI
ncbi:MAG: 3'-5' exonuclease [Thermodesulfovibrionales bacterium]|nr:3'-5' exonuclease [Thermodesulfovibrionales bacterium]